MKIKESIKNQYKNILLTENINDIFYPFINNNYYNRMLKNIRLDTNLSINEIEQKLYELLNQENFINSLEDIYFSIFEDYENIFDLFKGNSRLRKVALFSLAYSKDFQEKSNTECEEAINKSPYSKYITETDKYKNKYKTGLFGCYLVQHAGEGVITPKIYLAEGYAFYLLQSNIPKGAPDIVLVCWLYDTNGNITSTSATTVFENSLPNDVLSEIMGRKTFTLSDKTIVEYGGMTFEEAQQYIRSLSNEEVQ